MPINEKLSSLPIYTKNLAELKKFTGDLNSGKRCFSVGKNGQWQVTQEASGFGDRLLYTCGVKSAYNLQKLPSAFCQKYLYPLEELPVLFDAEKGALSRLKGMIFGDKNDPAIVSAKNLQREYFTAVIEATTAIEKAMKSANVKKSDELLLPLQAARCSLLYRIETENGGIVALDPSQVTVDKTLRDAAAKWKAKEKKYPESDRALSVRDEKHLKEMSRYPEFVKILNKFPALRDTYIKWSIRDNGSAKQFVEFMNFWHTKLDANFLTSRISYHGSSLLGIVKKASKKINIRKKVLTLPIEVMAPAGAANKLVVKDKNILDLTKSVTMNKNWKRTIGEIFRDFGNKNLDVGNVEFFGKGGVKNWNNQALGPYNPATKKHDSINLFAPEWWKQLPTLEPVEPITVKEMQRRHPGLTDLKAGDWVFIVRSARMYPTLDVDKAHGYFEVAIPQDDGTFKLYDFGKLAAVFPDGAWELLKFLANTVKAKIYYPDENIYYHSRQQAAWAKKLTEKSQINHLMDMLRDLIIRAKEGNLLFSFGYSNCSFEAQTLAEMIFGVNNVPDFFKISIFDLKLPQPLHALFSFFRLLPLFIRTLWVKFIVFTFGGWRGIEITEMGKRVFKNLTGSPFSKTHCNYLPSKLNHEILNKKIQGRVTFGVDAA